MIFMQKFPHGLLPDVFGNMFVRNVDIHGYYTRQSNKLHSPPRRLEIVRRSIRVQGTQFWNMMMDIIDHECSPASYKCQMKRHLLGNKLEIS